MSYSSSYTDSTTFTYTHARHLGAKVATDLKRMQRMYAYPTDTSIAQYEAEIIELLRHGYLEKVTYGFQRGGDWVEPTLRYTAQELAADTNDDDPGRIRPGANVSGATFYSFLEYSSIWDGLTSEERARFKEGLPFQRGTANAPGVSGYFVDDRLYASGSRSLSRSSVRSF